MSISPEQVQRLIETMKSLESRVSVEVGKAVALAEARLAADLSEKIDALKFDVAGKISALSEAINDRMDQAAKTAELNVKETGRRTSELIADSRRDFESSAEQIVADLMPVIRDLYSQCEAVRSDLDAIKSAPVETPTKAEPVEAATLADLITGRGNGFITSAVAVQYISREINAAIARAKG